MAGDGNGADALFAAIGGTPQRLLVGDPATVTASQVKRLMQYWIVRQREALRHYMAMPSAEPFHASRATWRLIDGSNRAGKTLTACAEVSRAVTGQDPYGKYPKENGRVLVVGKDGDHLANPLYEKMFRPGAFWMIPDSETGMWRAIRPNPADPVNLAPEDLARRKEWIPAPPLVPQRFIREIAWENKAKRIPRMIRLTTGWEMLWRSSIGDPPQGILLDLAWFDEEILNSTFYSETCARLVDRAGVGIWSATPQAATPQLWELRQRADRDDPSVLATTLLVADNPYLPPEAKDEFYKSLNEQERDVRWFGRYAILGKRIYGAYDVMGPHGYEPKDIPEDWTRYIILDPGRMHCGTLFGAIDPEERHVWIYDGFDLRNADAAAWANAVAERQGDMRFEAAICDQRMGRQHRPGETQTVAELYYTALIAAGVTPRLEGGLAGFFAGSDDVSAREEQVLSWLRIRSSGIAIGTPRLQVARGVLPELDNQIKAAHYLNETRRAKLHEDLLVCLEYFAAFNPYYQPPERVTPKEDPVWTLFQKRKKARRT